MVGRNHGGARPGAGRRYPSPYDEPRPRYDGPTWIGKPITPPPYGVGPQWVGKRTMVRSVPRGHVDIDALPRWMQDCS